MAFVSHHHYHYHHLLSLKKQQVWNFLREVFIDTEKEAARDTTLLNNSKNYCQLIYQCNVTRKPIKMRLRSASKALATSMPSIWNDRIIINTKIDTVGMIWMRPLLSSGKVEKRNSIVYPCCVKLQFKIKYLHSILPIL